MKEPKLVEIQKRWKLTPFPYTVVVCISSDVQASVKKREPNWDRNTTGAATINYSYKSVIVVPNKMSISSVVHEVTHAVANLQKLIGEKQKEEFVAYYSGYLSEQIIRFYLQKGRLTKDGAYERL